MSSHMLGTVLGEWLLLQYLYICFVGVLICVLLLRLPLHVFLAILILSNSFASVRLFITAAPALCTLTPLTPANTSVTHRNIQEFQENSGDFGEIQELGQSDLLYTYGVTAQAWNLLWASLAYAVEYGDSKCIKLFLGDGPTGIYQN